MSRNTFWLRPAPPPSQQGEWHDGFKYFAKCWSPSPGVLVSTLTIYDLGPADVGRYQCHMDNAIGSPAVRIVDLIYPCKSSHWFTCTHTHPHAHAVQQWHAHQTRKVFRMDAKILILDRRWEPECFPICNHLLWISDKFVCELLEIHGKQLSDVLRYPLI